MADEQPAIPDVGSVPAKEIVTGLLYQPFASGGRLSTPCTAGGVLSTLTLNLSTRVCVPHVAEQLKWVTPSVVSVVILHPVSLSGIGLNVQ